MNISEFKNIIWDYTRKINENTNKIFSPLCEQYGLTMLQVRILMELYKYESHSIGSLAEGIYVAGANISSMCKKLEHMDLLKRVRNQQDERVVTVALTQKGNEIVSRMDKFLNEKILQNIDEKAEETFDDIISGIKKLNDLMQNIVSAGKN
ncbi:organic hydroperoxide resistance transcriptional regulator [Oxobacter pfennigii]|uniref:Organic hydroperoxide resistance transcriptional regulator n=1 Tax=Oxobacter pfennigii TaxID=36849 RepID=A0A0P8YD75_9CLOT|nr:MarR family winged helix-turn-helix transcriptional regulator [Oxobacter pfennigii]KPU45190.1 organic hydroperoxide resistance transcriptional regulator [Oxobacter pfennigii]